MPDRLAFVPLTETVMADLSGVLAKGGVKDEDEEEMNDSQLIVAPGCTRCQSEGDRPQTLS